MRFFLPFLFLLPSTISHCQSVENITWDVSANTLDKPLVHDFPFNLKFINFESAKTCYDNLTLNILDINKGEIPVHKIPLSKKSESTYTASVFYRLKADEIYSLNISCNKYLTTNAVKSLKDFFEKKMYIEKFIVLEYIKKYFQNKYSNDSREEFLNKDLKEIIETLVKNYNPAYRFDNEIYTDLFYQAFNEISNTIENSKIIDITSVDAKSDPDWETLHNYYSIFKVNERLNEIDFKEFKRINKSLKEGILKELENVFKHIVSEDIIGTSFPNNISERVGRKLITHYGIGLGSKLSNKYPYFKETFPYTNIGLNYFFYPINNKYPIALYPKDGLKRISLHVSTTFIDLNPAIVDNIKRFGILNNQTLTFGVGYLIDDGILINAGALFYKESLDNPLVTNKDTRCMFSISLNADQALRNLYNSLIKK